jgi:DNA-binding transcriptional LysR family regulator
MEMPQIRYFLALSEELNFTRAAKQCGVSQPSLTNGIIELERHASVRHPGHVRHCIRLSSDVANPVEQESTMAGG